MLQKKGLASDVRATVAAVASAVPQPVFTSVVTGDATVSANLTQFTNRNGVQRKHQGGLKPRAERVGLGAHARRTANMNRLRLEDGIAPVTSTTTNFKPEAVRGAVEWLISKADISSNWTRDVKHRGRRVTIPSMLMRQHPSTLYTQYASDVTQTVGMSTFRGILDRAFTITKGRRAAMDYLWLTFGERNFAVVGEFITHCWHRKRVLITQRRQQALEASLDLRSFDEELEAAKAEHDRRIATMNQTQQFMEVDFPSLVRKCIKDASAGRCAAHDPRFALAESADVDMPLCCHCSCVAEFSNALSTMAHEFCATLQTNTSPPKGWADPSDVKKNVDKMTRYLGKFLAHQLQGQVQGLRCKELRANLPTDTAHLILDFKMKFLPVRLVACLFVVRVASHSHVC